jgi:hypothetical protein
VSRPSDGFEDFVAVRWPDLEGVARVVTLDADVARRVTFAAVTALDHQWQADIEEGRPEFTARRCLLSTALRSVDDRARPRSEVPPPAITSAARGLSGEDGGDSVRLALAAVIRAATPLQRAVVGARGVWGAEPDEVADLLGLPAIEVRRAAAALRAGLVAAHDAARTAVGLEPARWALDGELTSVVDQLLSGQPGPPDPAALAEHRRHTVHRRSLVAAGAAVVVTGATAWWVLPRHVASAGPSSTDAALRALPPPDDIRWQSISRWVPRGRLSTDARVLGLVTSHGRGAGARVLWADDVAGTRLVLSGSPSGDTSDGVVLQAWQGRAGADPASLREVRLTTGAGGDGTAVVTLAVPTAFGSLLVLLARPTVTTASYSATVVPTAAGAVERAWTSVPLRWGVGSATWPQEPGPALRVTCGDFDGPPLAPPSPWEGRAGPTASGYATEVRRLVAEATGAPLREVHTEVVVDATSGRGALDEPPSSPRDGEGRVRVLRTTTAGALIRSARLVAGTNTFDVEPPVVLAAGTPADDPIVLEVDEVRPGVSRFLVIAPGASRVQLISTSPKRIASAMTPAPQGVAIVTAAFGAEAAGLHLAREDPHGHVVRTGLPRAGRDLLDLWPAAPALGA